MTLVPFEFSLERGPFCVLKSRRRMNATQTRWVLLPDEELQGCFNKHADSRNDVERAVGYKLYLVSVVMYRKKHYVRVVCKQTSPTFSCLITFDTVLGYFENNYRFNVDVSGYDCSFIHVVNFGFAGDKSKGRKVVGNAAGAGESTAAAGPKNKM